MDVKNEWRVCGERGSANIAYTKVVLHQKIPSAKSCEGEGFWDFVAVNFPRSLPFPELSTNSLGFYERSAPSTRFRFLQNPVCALPFRLPLKKIRPWRISRSTQGTRRKARRKCRTERARPTSQSRHDPVRSTPERECSDRTRSTSKYMTTSVPGQKTRGRTCSHGLGRRS